ncbi:helix-turn-helix domain-containing protein, partial [Campylobacter fetus]
MGYGNQIKAIRIEKDISRVELADMIGVSIKTMYNYENEITKISSEDLQKISNILNYNFMSSNMSSKNNKYVKQSQNLSSNKPLNTSNLKKSQDIINIPYFEDTYASA